MIVVSIFLPESKAWTQVHCSLKTLGELREQLRDSTYLVKFPQQQQHVHSK